MMHSRPGFFSFGKKPFVKKRDGVSIKSITGHRSQLTIVRLEPGMKTRHAHSNEQIGYVLVGRVKIEIAGASKTLGPGDGYFIPSNVEHAFRVPSTGHVEYIEIFCPPKRENVTDD